jgi:hypothetical protein
MSMATSRAHYEKVARVIRTKLSLYEDHPARKEIVDLAIDLAAIYKEDNPHFKFGKFYEACGITTLDRIR